MKLSMRPLLCCLAVVVMLPSASLTAYGIFSDREAAAAAARARFDEILQRAAVRYGRQAEHACSLLMSLADNEKVRGGYRTEMTDLFTDIVLNDPRYENIYLVGGDGAVRVSALPFVRGSAALKQYCATAARAGTFFIGAVPADARSGRAAFRCAVPLREDANGAAAACLTAEVCIDGEAQELLSGIDGALLVFRDAFGHATALYPPDRGMPGNADVFAEGDAGRDRVVLEHKIPGGAGQDAFAVLLLSVPAGAVYGESDDIVRKRVPILAAAVLGGLFVAYVVAGARAAAPLSETAAAARALSGNFAPVADGLYASRFRTADQGKGRPVLPADGRPVFQPERYGESGVDDAGGNGPVSAFAEAAALSAALGKTAARLHALRTTAAEAGAAGEEAGKTWNDVLFSLGRDMREPVNTIRDLAHVAQKAARDPQLRNFLDEIVSAGGELGALSDELAALHETEPDTRE